MPGICGTLPDVADEPGRATCACSQRPTWARLEDEAVLHWPVVEVGEWEELRQCPDCGYHWLTTWPEELDGNPILCRPIPAQSRRLRDIDRLETLRPYCLARLEEHLGQLREEKRPCKKLGCEGAPADGRLLLPGAPHRPALRPPALQAGPPRIDSERPTTTAANRSERAKSLCDPKCKRREEHLALPAF